MGLPSERRLPMLQCRIEEIVENKAVVLDQFGVKRSINIRVRPAKGDPPRVGEVWYVDRPFGDWTLVACVQADWSWETWTPVLAASAGVITVVAHEASRVKWTRYGNTVSVIFAKVLRLSAAANWVSITLPLPSFNPRVVFSGEAINALCRCGVGDSALDRVSMYPVNPFPAATDYWFTFTGTYEVAP